jgi:hypothetical protein
MDLTSQIKALVDDAPADDGTRQLVENVAIALAQWVNGNLSHSHYYLIQDVSGAWIKSTLIHRTQSIGEKPAIFIFSDSEDVAKEIDNLQDIQVFCEKIPVIELLFRFWTLNLSDSLVVNEGGVTTRMMREITRSDLNTAIRGEKSQKKTRNTQSGKGFGNVC